MPAIQTQQMQPIIKLSNVTNRLGNKDIHRNLDLDIYPNEIVAIIGASGCGKTTLLRSILMLLRPISGNICIFDIDITQSTEKEAQEIRRRWGVMFQSSALFSSLTVLENTLYPLQQFSHLTCKMREEIALLKIKLVGLELEAANKLPDELSGGMKKRAAMARAIALDPELVFLDEPTAGIDPESASELDELMLNLRDSLGLTIVMVTHDIDTLWKVPDRVVFLGEQKVLAVEPMEQLVNNSHPLIQDYFSSDRTRKRVTQHTEEVNDGHEG